MITPKTLDIACLGYSVKTDMYESGGGNAVLLSLIGRSSNRGKKQYRQLFPKIADELGITTVIFDYSGHGDSPYEIEDICPAQHFLEVISVFDWMKVLYPDRKIFVIGSSYGGFMATQLTKYRAFDGLILRAPAIYKPDDFYTKKRDENRNQTMSLRRDKDALGNHPLLARASHFTGDTLLIIHKHDEEIPVETTDAYATAFKAEVNIQPVTHSLDNADEDLILAYNHTIYSWLKSKI